MLRTGLRRIRPAVPGGAYAEGALGERPEVEEFTGGGKRISRLICAIDLIEVNAKRRRSRKDRVARFSLDPRKSLRSSRGLMSAWRFMVYSRVYLKICEGCGGLWFRAQDGNGVYCASCTSRLRNFSRPKKRRSGRPRMHTLLTAGAKGGAR